MGTLTDVGPAGLVPAAWLVTAGAHVSLVTERTLLIALLVMDALLVAFVVASRGEMTGSVLPIWRRVLLAGLVVTLAGTAGLAADPNLRPLVAVGLYGWLVLPGLAYVGTGRAHPPGRYRRLYLAAAALSLAGTGIYAVGHLGGVAPTAATLAGLGVAGAGQTAGIVAAAYQNASDSRGRARSRL
jgi:hypothetical protein